MSDPISVRTAASALLSAADIWSTDGRASAPAIIPETKKAETAPAEIPETKRAETTGRAEIPEQKKAETIAPARTLRPSELLAEARFFSMIAKRVLDLTPAGRKSAEIKSAEIKAAEI